MPTAEGVKIMSRSPVKQQRLLDQQNAIDFLKAHLKDGNYVYGVTRHITRSNEYRYLRFYIITPESYPRNNQPYNGHRLQDITSELMQAFPYRKYSTKHNGIEFQWNNGDDIQDDIERALWGPRNDPTAYRNHLYYTHLNW